MSSSILENPDENEVGESHPMASSTPITSPSSSSGSGNNQAQDLLERSEVVTFDSRKSVKRLDKIATVSRFRQNFEK